MHGCFLRSTAILPVVGYLSCNLLRLVGALLSFATALAAIKWAGASVYGLFLFVVSLLSLLPDYFSSLVSAEYVNTYSREYSKDSKLHLLTRESLAHYSSLFGFFLLSCLVSLLVILCIPSRPGSSSILVVLAAAFVYMRQHLTVLAVKLRLHVSPLAGDALQYFFPQLLCLGCLYFFQSKLLPAALSIELLGLSFFLAYLAALVAASVHPISKLLVVENIVDCFSAFRAFGLQQSNQSKQARQFSVDRLSLATSLSYLSTRAPALFIGFAGGPIANVAIYGIFQRVQYLVMLPGYAYLSWTSKRLVEAAKRAGQHQLIRLTFGAMMISILSPVLFFVVYVAFPGTFFWGFDLLKLNGEFGLDLLLVALGASSFVVLHDFFATVFNVVHQLRRLLESQMLRIAVLIFGLGGFALAGRLNVFDAFALEWVSLGAVFLYWLIFSYSKFLRQKS